MGLLENALGPSAREAPPHPRVICSIPCLARLRGWCEPGLFCGKSVQEVQDSALSRKTENGCLPSNIPCRCIGYANICPGALSRIISLLGPSCEDHGRLALFCLRERHMRPAFPVPQTGCIIHRRGRCGHGPANSPLFFISNPTLLRQKRMTFQRLSSRYALGQME